MLEGNAAHINVDMNVDSSVDSNGNYSGVDFPHDWWSEGVSDDVTGIGGGDAGKATASQVPALSGACG
jgi:hypothetical protein